MSPLEIIEEWRRGCSCATPGKPEECAECTRAAIDALQNALLKQEVGLRALRLTHWDATLICWAAGLDQTANVHIGYVQLLNDFFPSGDTAEKDAQARSL